jgi:hypothetical protein
MPRLSERTHRLICRAGFIILCALPTLWVVVWMIAHKLPSHRAGWEAALVARLDAEVHIDAVSHPQPGVTRLEGLQLVEPGGQQPWIEIARLELRSYRGMWIAQADCARLRNHPNALRRLLTRCALPHPGSNESSVQLSMDRVELLDAGEEAVLRQVVVQRDAGGELRATALASENAESPWRLELAPHDGGQRMRLDTGTTPLPAFIAAWVLPAVRQLGNDANYLGTADLLIADDGVSGQAAGTFRRLDLKFLTEQFLPADMRLTGETELALADVRLLNGRLVRADGSFRSQSGTVLRPWLEGLVHELNVQWQTAVVGRPEAAAEETRYQEFAFHFLIEPHQVRLTGTCSGAPAGTMMTGVDGSSILSTAASQPQPATALARLLSPPTRDWIPATSQAQWVWRHLPARDGNTANRSRDGRR